MSSSTAASLVLDDDEGWRSPVLPQSDAPPLVLGRGTCNIDIKEVQSAARHTPPPLVALSLPY